MTFFHAFCTIMKKIKTIQLTEEILLWLVDLIKAPVKAFFDVPYCYAPKRRYYSAIESLQRGKFIKKENKNIVITKKGKIKGWYLKWKIKKISIKNWDGKWRILFFDIPEFQKSLREKLRKRLIVLNFVRLQDSVWVTPLPVEKEIEVLAEILKIKNCIRYVVTNELNFDEDLKKKFFTK